MLSGIDISKWQTTTPSLNGLSFVVIKASQGKIVDPMYATHYANARKAGVVVMAYCFGLDDAVVPVEDQVSTFLATARDADFLWLDQEAAGFSDAEAQKFIDLVRANGRPCGLYHSSSGFAGVNADAEWVADWRSGSVSAGYPRTPDGTKEFPGWDLWQWTGTPLDKDYLNPDSTLASLLRVGYITETAAKTRTALAVENATKPLEDQIDTLSHTVEAQAATISEQNKAIILLQGSLAAAPGIERKRIADSEAARIAAI